MSFSFSLDFQQWQLLWRGTQSSPALDFLESWMTPMLDEGKTSPELEEVLLESIPSWLNHRRPDETLEKWLVHPSFDAWLSRHAVNIMSFFRQSSIDLKRPVIKSLFIKTFQKLDEPTQLDIRDKIELQTFSPATSYKDDDFDRRRRREAWKEVLQELNLVKPMGELVQGQFWWKRRTDMFEEVLQWLHDSGPAVASLKDHQGQNVFEVFTRSFKNKILSLFDENNANFSMMDMLLSIQRYTHEALLEHEQYKAGQQFHRKLKDAKKEEVWSLWKSACEKHGINPITAKTPQGEPLFLMVFGGNDKALSGLKKILAQPDGDEKKKIEQAMLQTNRQGWSCVEYWGEGWWGKPESTLKAWIDRYVIERAERTSVLMTWEERLRQSIYPCRLPVSRNQNDGWKEDPDQDKALTRVMRGTPPLDPEADLLRMVEKLKPVQQRLWKSILACDKMNDYALDPPYGLGLASLLRRRSHSMVKHCDPLDTFGMNGKVPLFTHGEDWKALSAALNLLGNYQYAPKHDRWIYASTHKNFHGLPVEPMREFIDTTRFLIAMTELMIKKESFELSKFSLLSIKDKAEELIEEGSTVKQRLMQWPSTLGQPPTEQEWEKVRQSWMAKDLKAEELLLSWRSHDLNRKWSEKALEEPRVVAPKNRF